MGAEQSGPEEAVLTKKNMVKGKSKAELDSKRQHDVYGKRGTRLHIAAANGDEKQVRVLVKQGGDRNSKDLEGRTPFMMACKYGKLQTARVLIKLGANPDLKDNQGQTAKMYATQVHVKDWLNRYMRTRKLSDEGEMQIHNYKAIMMKSKTFASSNDSNTSASSRDTAQAEHEDDPPSRSSSASSASSQPSQHTPSEPSRAPSEASWRTASTTSKSSWKESFNKFKSMPMLTTSESTGRTRSARSAAPDTTADSGQSAWAKVRAVVNTGMISRTSSAEQLHGGKPSPPTTTSPLIGNPGETIRESMGAIKLEYARQLPVRKATTGADYDAAHKMSNFHVSLGSDVATALHASFKRVESAKRKGNARQ